MCKYIVARMFLIISVSVLSSSVNARLGDINRVEIWMRSQSKSSTYECARSGDLKCQIAMGLYFYQGHRFYFSDDRTDDYTDIKKAKYWFHMNTGKSLVARILMGQIYRDEGNDKEGLALLNSAGYEGSYDAMLILSRGDIKLYDNSDKNEAEQLKWSKNLYGKFPSGQPAYNIAMSYFYSAGGSMCLQGVEWIKKSAFLHDDMDAQEYIGSLYEQGYCLPQNNIMAYMMYDLGGTGASDKKQAIAQKMTPEEIDEATRRSHDWQDEHHSYRPSYGSGASIYWNVH